MVRVNNEGKIVAGSAVLGIMLNGDLLPVSKSLSAQTFEHGEVTISIENNEGLPLFAELSFSTTGTNMFVSYTSTDRYTVEATSTEEFPLGLTHAPATFKLVVQLHFAYVKNPVQFEVELTLKLKDR